MGLLRRELARLTRLALPVAITQLSTMLLWTVDLLMVARVGVEAINAVSLGRIWVMGTTIVGMGFLFGLDGLAAQAHGARAARRLGSLLAHGSWLAVGISLPLGILWLFTGPLLVLAGQEPATAALAHRYVLVQIPSLPFFLLFVAWKQFLQARGIVRPAMWVGFLGNGLNVLLDWLLVFGHAGLPALGAVGAGVATALTQAVLFLALALVVWRARLLRGVRWTWSLAALARAELAAIARLGAPVAVQLGFEYWAFAIALLWAGWLGPVELAAHAVALNLASITYMLPLGVSLAAAARVGQLIGAGDGAGARRSAWLALALGGGLMAVCALVFVAGRRFLPGLYGADAAVLALASSVLPIAAAFQLFDGLQVVASGVLRGMGRPRPAALANLFGFYAAALPLGWWLAFRAGFGLAGLWWGLALGLATVALALVLLIARRGPDRVVALVRPR
ncbi:MAG TPA: MATE family efflux transporter [Thermoanaerobaculia bacterium]|nr:MATE family efflux transporter [Thermoanaerobaculia bacterium]